MAGRPSAKMIEAMKLVLAGVTPYAAAKRLGLAVETMYRSRLYKLWQKSDIVSLKQEMDVYRHVVRARKKPKACHQENLDG